jgi:hypothetical protein
MSQDTGTADTEAAYVFAYENGRWGRQAKLMSDTGAGGDQTTYIRYVDPLYRLVTADQPTTAAIL